jgi:hypothetical protein
VLPCTSAQVPWITHVIALLGQFRSSEPPDIWGHVYDLKMILATRTDEDFDVGRWRRRRPTHQPACQSGSEWRVSLRVNSALWVALGELQHVHDDDDGHRSPQEDLGNGMGRGVASRCRR